MGTTNSSGKGVHFYPGGSDKPPAADAASSSTPDANASGTASASKDACVWDKIKDCVLKALCACQEHIPYNPNAFEVFGFDVLLDENLKVWLIE